MRKIWVKLESWQKELVTTALEGGAEAVMLPEGYAHQAKKLGKIKIIAKDGDWIPGKDVTVFKIKSGGDEDEIVALSRQSKVILECSDWTIIPLENLIARGADIVARVNGFEEAQTAFHILEKGVDRILLCTDDPLELKKTLSLINDTGNRIKLHPAEITAIKSVGMGDRVCVDTCTAMTAGQGMLTGNSSQALFLIHSESIDNPYVSPRPFRVNAGAVHAHTRVPGGKTRYLSELSAGDEVMLIDFQGNATVGVVGRLKIEKRPLMLITAVASEKKITTIVQNAETIRLVSPEGKPKSVVNLQKGDAVLVAMEKAGRHFGHKIEETIHEK